MGAACCNANDERNGLTAVATPEAAPTSGDPDAPLEPLAPDEDAKPKGEISPAAAKFEPAEEREGGAAKERAVTLKFLKHDGTPEDYVLRRRPLGLDFKKEVPLKVKTVKAGSVGQELGIQPGWTILQINDKDITSYTFNESFQALKEAFEGVPCVPP